jgi:preprotein translocase subunit SecG
METVLLAIHIILVVALVLIILVQRTSSDGLSGLGGGSSQGAIFSSRGSANFLTRATAILATGFICTSLALAYIASHREGGSIADTIAAEQKANKTPAQPAAPTAQPNTAAPAATAPANTAAPAAEPAAPAVPLAQ